VAASLPATLTASGAGIQAARAAGAPWIGGSGGDALAAASGVDVVVTSDLKHHLALDHLQAGGPALVDVAHFASEWPWVPAYASLLHRDLLAAGFDVDVQYSSLVTDPWTSRA
jgi:putative NIF3 family GTP cyclohydrolase 1 type 2